MLEQSGLRFRLVEEWENRHALIALLDGARNVRASDLASLCRIGRLADRYYERWSAGHALDTSHNQGIIIALITVMTEAERLKAENERLEAENERLEAQLRGAARSNAAR